MTDRELMQQALDAMEEGLTSKQLRELITALRERLAQPEQEPVLWRNAAIRVGEELSSVGPDGYYDMTAEQWLDWAMAQDPRGKNSLAQPEQEPVAWMHNHISGSVITHRPADIDRHPNRWTALYKDPTPCQTCEALARTVMMDQTSHDTQRKPLTEEEIERACAPLGAAMLSFTEVARVIEAAHGIKGEA